MTVGRFPSLAKLKKLGSTRPSNVKELVSLKAKNAHVDKKSIFRKRIT